MRLRQQTVPARHKNKQQQDSAGMFSLQADADVPLSLIDKGAVQVLCHRWHLLLEGVKASPIMYFFSETQQMAKQEFLNVNKSLLDYQTLSPGCLRPFHPSTLHLSRFYSDQLFKLSEMKLISVSRDCE